MRRVIFLITFFLWFIGSSLSGQINTHAQNNSCGTISPTSFTEEGFDNDGLYDYYYLTIPLESTQGDFRVSFPGIQNISDFNSPKSSAAELENSDLGFFVNINNQTILIKVGGFARNQPYYNLLFSANPNPEKSVTIYRDGGVYCTKTYTINALNPTATQTPPTPTLTPIPTNCFIEFEPANGPHSSDTNYSVKIVSTMETLLQYKEPRSVTEYLLIADVFENNNGDLDWIESAIENVPLQNLIINEEQIDEYIKYYLFQNLGRFNRGQRVTVQVSKVSTRETLCEGYIDIGEAPVTPSPTPLPTPTPINLEELRQRQLEERLSRVCANIDEFNKNGEPNPEYAACKLCVIGDGQDTGTYTAIGCIPNNLSRLFSAEYLLGPAMGIIGGIAFLLMLTGGFQIVMSGGDPQRIQQGRELIISAISGVLLIIFAFLIIGIIAGDILKIPGFGIKNYHSSCQTSLDAGDDPASICSITECKQHPVCKSLNN